MTMSIQHVRSAVGACLLAAMTAAVAGEAPDGSAAIPGPGESRAANAGGTTQGVNPAANPGGRSPGGSAGGTRAGDAPAGQPDARKPAGGGATGINAREAEALEQGAQRTPSPVEIRNRMPAPDATPAPAAR